ncbi:50S ribosomal protein L13 [Candidatus Curtissbacteria bacterium RIFCSPLOWO2_01_FULL_38_11b]|uniref:Large ribosomal subunit protein uL13 n=1 Tax=Candidatus Curtissbacteria bacterium RIFCSPLOWO2_01_FULL_38_11b TaxID=1797725 RepID=A0A1F5H1L4_9BACT|nr:MAG: 50S ribosomal protein L13 [Candidatus Curtissbacteria bacterium RIFCSPLOWO2_01_FULL_38_11b]
MKNIKLKDIKKDWHLIDAKDKVLGRLCSQAAVYLMGKNKSYFTPYLDTGDFVVIINAKDVKLTGKKEIQKKYWRHSGFPGGISVKTASQIRAENPQTLIRHAISGMLPKTTLGKQMIKKLYVYDQKNHPHETEFKN